MSSEQIKINKGDVVQRPSLNRRGPVIREVVEVDEVYLALRDSQGNIRFVRREESRFRPVSTLPVQYQLFNSRSV